MENKIQTLIGDVPVSATLGINMKIREMKAKGIEVTHFGFGQSPFPVAPCMIEELKKHAHIKDYLPVSGIVELKDAIAKYHTKVDKVKCDPDQIIVAPGSKELLFTVQQQIYDNDWYIISPSWVSYGNQLHAFKHKKGHFIKATKESRFFPKLENQTFPKKSFFIINSPCNPTGQCLTEEESKYYAKFMNDNDCYLLSDEIYGPLQFDGKFKSMRCYLPERTIISGGISKWACAGGWRIGYFIFPKSLLYLKQQIEAVCSETYSCASVPIQYGAIPAFTDSYMDKYLEQQRLILQVIGKWTAQSLKNAGIDVLMPEGGFYIYVGFEKFTKALEKLNIKDSVSLYSYILDHKKVAILAGKYFHDLEGFKGRLAYVDFTGQEALNQLSNYDLSNKEEQIKYIKEVAPNVYNGVQRLIEFCKELEQQQ